MISRVAWDKSKFTIFENSPTQLNLALLRIRTKHDGAERQQWNDLSSILNSVVLSSFKDRWTCDLSGDGEFKVKVIRNFIDDLFLPSSDVATRWVKFIPIKVNVFSWRARRDRLPTRVNLSRRGVLLDSHLCPLCNAAMEDVQHVFFRRDVARVVLRKICRWWDLNWQEICSFSDWDAWFLSFRLSSRLKSILEGVFYVAWWRIWRLRNQLVFDASPPNRSTIFDDIMQAQQEYKIPSALKSNARIGLVIVTMVWQKNLSMKWILHYQEHVKYDRRTNHREVEKVNERYVSMWIPPDFTFSTWLLGSSKQDMEIKNFRLLEREGSVKLKGIGSFFRLHRIIPFPATMQL
ncbi:RNA-directed DNA polymerase, eukaryota [Tanacetum coccineum]